MAENLKKSMPNLKPLWTSVQLRAAGNVGRERNEDPDRGHCPYASRVNAKGNSCIHRRRHDVCESHGNRSPAEHDPASIK